MTGSGSNCRARILTMTSVSGSVLCGARVVTGGPADSVSGAAKKMQAAYRQISKPRNPISTSLPLPGDIVLHGRPTLPARSGPGCRLQDQETQTGFQEWR